MTKTALEILKEVEENVTSDSTDEDDNNLKEEEEFNEPCPFIDMITLVSCDGRRFHVQRKVALMSNLLKFAFQPGSKFKEAVKSEFKLQNIRGVVLEKIVDYLQYSYMYHDNIHNAPKFDVQDDILLETLVAADYLMI